MTVTTEGHSLLREPVVGRTERAVKWLRLHRRAVGDPESLDVLTESAAAVLLACGVMEAQQTIADGKYPLDTYFLCLVLDAYSVPVPEDAVRAMRHRSDP